MAFHGELVRMRDGRWARFQECAIYKDGNGGPSRLPLLVAVELDESMQALLNSSEGDIQAMYREDGVPVRMDYSGPDADPAFTYGVQSAR